MNQQSNCVQNIDSLPCYCRPVGCTLRPVQPGGVAHAMHTCACCQLALWKFKSLQVGLLRSQGQTGQLLRSRRSSHYPASIAHAQIMQAKKLVRPWPDRLKWLLRPCTGQVSKRPYPTDRAMRKLTVPVQLQILQLAIENPGIYLHQIQEQLQQRLQLEISIATICRCLKVYNAL